MPKYLAFMVLCVIVSARFAQANPTPAPVNKIFVGAPKDYRAISLTLETRGIPPVKSGTSVRFKAISDHVSFSPRMVDGVFTNKLNTPTTPIVWEIENGLILSCSENDRREAACGPHTTEAIFLVKVEEMERLTGQLKGVALDQFKFRLEGFVSITEGSSGEGAANK